MEAPLSHSLAIQARVIGALLMRELVTRYGRRNIGFLWLFVEPMMFTTGVTLLWTALRSTHGSSLAIMPFAITGYSAILLWRNGANRCAKAIGPNLSLLYHRNVTVLDIFIARLLLEVAGATISLVVLLGGLILFGWADAPADLLTMTIGWLMLIWFTAGLALIVGALSERSEAFERLWHTLTYLMFPFSGAAFMVEWLPPRMQEVVLWIPVVHGVEMLRGGYYGNLVHPHYSLAYLVLANSIMLWVGLMLAARSQQLVIAE